MSFLKSNNLPVHTDHNCTGFQKVINGKFRYNFGADEFKPATVCVSKFQNGSQGYVPTIGVMFTFVLTTDKIVSNGERGCCDAKLIFKEKNYVCINGEIYTADFVEKTCNTDDRYAVYLSADDVCNLFDKSDVLAQVAKLEKELAILKQQLS